MTRLTEKGCPSPRHTAQVTQIGLRPQKLHRDLASLELCKSRFENAGKFFFSLLPAEWDDRSKPFRATLAATPLLYGKAHQALTRFLFILSFPLMSAPLLQDIKAASRAHLSFEAAHEGVQPLPGGKDLPFAAGFVVLRCCRAIIMPRGNEGSPNSNALRPSVVTASTSCGSWRSPLVWSKHPQTGSMNQGCLLGSPYNKHTLILWPQNMCGHRALSQSASCSSRHRAAKADAV